MHHVFEASVSIKRRTSSRTNNSHPRKITVIKRLKVIRRTNRAATKAAPVHDGMARTYTQKASSKAATTLKPPCACKSGKTCVKQKAGDTRAVQTCSSQPCGQDRPHKREIHNSPNVQDEAATAHVRLVPNDATGDVHSTRPPFEEGLLRRLRRVYAVNTKHT